MQSESYIASSNNNNNYNNKNNKNKNNNNNTRSSKYMLKAKQILIQQVEETYIMWFFKDTP